MAENYWNCWNFAEILFRRPSIEINQQIWRVKIFRLKWVEGHYLVYVILCEYFKLLYGEFLSLIFWRTEEFLDRLAADL